MSTELPFAQIDAFAAQPFKGNPAAVIALESWLADDVMQAIAEENNLAETAFFIPHAGNAAAYELRWFTPEVEVDLCGHATLASGHYLLSRADGMDSVRFLTRKAGVLEVRRAANGYEVDLPALYPTPADADPGFIKALGKAPQQVLGVDTGYWLCIYDDARHVRGLQPDFAALRSFGIDLIVASAPGDGGVDVVSRVFAAGVGIDEDPVTGAAHAMLTPYWAARLGQPAFTAYQASARGGHIACRLDGDRAVLGGTCVTVIEGRFRL